MLPRFYITHLYPQHMCIYGDMGNILAMKYRVRELGFEPIYQIVNPGDRLPTETDFYFIGGGQDKEQYLIFQDLLEKKERLIEDIESGVSLLSVCGGYQLLGKSFLTGEGLQIEGIGVFPVETVAPDYTVKTRCIGNIVVECTFKDLQGVKLVGFENHGGQTYFVKPKVKDSVSSEESGQAKELEKESIEEKTELEVPEKGRKKKKKEIIMAETVHEIPQERGMVLIKKYQPGVAVPLGKVLIGFGNNATEKMEGCVYKHAIGTYLHGSCLPKNPELADWLIKKTLEVKGERDGVDYLKDLNFETLNNDIELVTKESLIERFTV